jgi:hypothetical protein
MMRFVAWSTMVSDEQHPLGEEQTTPPFALGKLAQRPKPKPYHKVAQMQPL